MVFRVLAAITASLMTPAAFAMAAAVAPPGRAARYLGTVATFALVVGVPGAGQRTASGAAGIAGAVLGGPVTATALLAVLGWTGRVRYRSCCSAY